MGHKHVKFKESQLYTWESEPVDERPSEFMSSTGYASLSGYHSAIDPVRRVRRGNRFGLAGMLAVALAFIAAGGWVIVRFAPLLHR
ncbi:MAG TPA: hypothetical protein VIO33_03430 [Burkholderiaceae bacterium]|jgi:hypothetical protein